MHKTLDLNASCSTTGLKASYTLKAGFKYKIKRPACSKIEAWSRVDFFIDDGAGNIVNFIGYAAPTVNANITSMLDELILLGDGTKRLCIYYTQSTTTTVNATIPYEETRL